jgi:hypothetical protein
VKYTLTIDWLTLSLKGVVQSLPECPVGFRQGGFTFILLSSGTRHYKHLAKIQYFGKPWGEIAFKPNSAILPADSCQLKLENCVLYEKDLRVSVQDFFTQTGFVLRSITRLDIALDFEEFRNGWSPAEFINRLANDEVSRLGRAANLDIKRRGSEITGAVWGSMASERSFTLYNKTVELKRGNKTYITDYHRQNGLGLGRDVWRMEARLKNPELKKLYAIEPGTGEIGQLTLLDFLSNDFLVLAFQKEVDSYMTFVFVEGERRKSNCATVDLVKLDLPPSEQLVRFSTKPSASAFRVKVTVKALCEQYYKYKNKSALSMAVQLMVENNLLEHVNRRLSWWKREFFASMDPDYNYMCPVKEACNVLDLDELRKYSDLYEMLAAAPKVKITKESYAFNVPMHYQRIRNNWRKTGDNA